MRAVACLAVTVLAAHAAAAPLKIAVLCPRRLAPYGDLLTVTLSEQEGLVLVERNDLDGIAKEHGLSLAKLVGTQAVQVGRLAAADALIQLSEEMRYGDKTHLRTRIVSVAPGVIVEDLSVPVPKDDPNQWQTQVSASVTRLLPQLRKPTSRPWLLIVSEIKSSLVNTRTFGLEAEFQALLQERLSREPQLFVLERRQLDDVQFEKDLANDTGKLWSGRLAVEGFIEQPPDPKEPVRVVLNLKKADGTTFPPAEATGDPLRAAELAKRAAAALLKTLDLSSKAPEGWSLQAEADFHLRRAHWLMSIGSYPDARAAAEAAWHLGKKGTDMAALLIELRARHVANYIWPAHVDMPWGAALEDKWEAMGRRHEAYHGNPEFTEELQHEASGIIGLAGENIAFLGHFWQHADKLDPADRDRCYRATSACVRHSLFALHRARDPRWDRLREHLQKAQTNVQRWLPVLLTAEGGSILTHYARFTAGCHSDAESLGQAYLVLMRETFSNVEPEHVLHRRAGLRYRLVDGFQQFIIQRTRDGRSHPKAPFRTVFDRLKGQATTPEDHFVWAVLRYLVTEDTTEKENLIAHAYQSLWDARTAFNGVPSNGIRWYYGMLRHLADSYSSQHVALTQVKGSPQGLLYSPERHRYTLRYLLYLLEHSSEPSSAIKNLGRDLMVSTLADARKLHAATRTAHKRVPDLPHYSARAFPELQEKLERTFPGLLDTQQERCLDVTRFWSHYRHDAPVLADGTIPNGMHGLSWFRDRVWAVAHYFSSLNVSRTFLLSIDPTTFENDAIIFPDELTTVNLRALGVFEWNRKLIVLHTMGVAEYSPDTGTWWTDTSFEPHDPRYSNSRGYVQIGDLLVFPTSMSHSPRLGSIMSFDLRRRKTKLIASGRRSPPQSPLDIAGCLFQVCHSNRDGEVGIISKPGRGGRYEAQFYNVASGKWRPIPPEFAELRYYLPSPKPAPGELLPYLHPQAVFILDPRERIRFAHNIPLPSGVGRNATGLTIQTAKAPECVFIPLQFSISEDERVLILSRQYGEVTRKNLLDLTSRYEHPTLAETLVTPAGLVIALRNAASGFYLIPKDELISAYEEFRDNPVPPSAQSGAPPARTRAGARQSHSTTRTHSAGARHEPSAQDWSSAGQGTGGHTPSGYRESTLERCIPKRARVPLLCLTVALLGFMRWRRRRTQRTALLFPLLLVSALSVATSGARAADANAKLLKAVESGDKATVAELLKGKPDLNTLAEDGLRTPLLVACDQGHVEIAQILVKAGADLNLANSAGCTPLMVSAGRASPRLTTFLLKHGADINAWFGKGYPAESFALGEQRFDNVRGLLTARGVDVSGLDEKELEAEATKVRRRCLFEFDETIRRKYHELVQADGSEHSAANGEPVRGASHE